jgi:hypothetical protein
MVEAVLGHGAWLEILADHVGRRAQAPRRFGALLRMQVDADALLVAVEHREEA